MTAHTLDVSPDELAVVRAILQQDIPKHDVWAFGSRVNGSAKKFSDLDLIIRGEEPLPLGIMAELADAFSESDLPYKVDLVDWVTTSEKFRGAVQEAHVRLSLYSTL